MGMIKILEELVSAVTTSNIQFDIKLSRGEDGELEIQFSHWNHIYAYDHQNIYFRSYHDKQQINKNLELALQVIEGKRMIGDGE